MKNNIIFAFAIFAAVFFADNSQADDFTYFNTTLCKDFINQGSSASEKNKNQNGGKYKTRYTCMIKR